MEMTDFYMNGNFKQVPRRVKCAAREGGFISKKYSTTPLLRTLVIRITNNPGQLGPTGRYVEK
jgi:hypothetical protein